MTPRYRMGVGRARFKQQWNQPVARNETPVELTLVLHQETDLAWLVSELGNREKAVWLAKSLVERDERVRFTATETVEGIEMPGERNSYDFLVPEWLANERGLL